MALRNIGRNKRRTLLAVLSVALSITFIVFMKAFVTGFIGSIVRNYTRQECGHIRITTAKFADRAQRYPVGYNLKNTDSLIDIIKSAPGIGDDISFITERFMFGVLLNNDGNTKPAIAIAGDPQKEKELSMLYKSLLPESRYSVNSREMIMGYKLAALLGYRPGDTVRVMTQGADNALHLRKFLCTGLFKTGINSFDDRIFQIGIEDARALLRAGGDAQQIVLFLDDYKKADAGAALIRTALSDTSLSVASWTTIGSYYSLVKMSGAMYNWLYGFIALLGAFIISNIMMMVVLERKKEIGILKSMGMKRREILSLFFCEGVIMGTMGSVAGVLFGSIVNAILSVTGIDFTKMMSTVTIPMDNVIYPRTDPVSLLQMFIIGIIVSSIVALLPSRQAAGMNAVDAIKSV
jgi:putative ABC transport system permease protein